MARRQLMLKPYGDKALEESDTRIEELAYALTVHKTHASRRTKARAKPPRSAHADR